MDFSKSLHGIVLDRSSGDNYYKEINNVKVRILFNVTSDHYLSQIKMNLIPALNQKLKLKSVNLTTTYLKLTKRITE